MQRAGGPPDWGAPGEAPHFADAPHDLPAPGEGEGEGEGDEAPLDGEEDPVKVGRCRPPPHPPLNRSESARLRALPPHPNPALPPAAAPPAGGGAHPPAAAARAARLPPV